MAEVGAKVAIAEAAWERKEQQDRAEAAARSRIAREGAKVLLEIVDRLFARIQEAAPTAKVGPSSIVVGQGMLQVSLRREGSQHSIHGPFIHQGAFSQSKWDVVIGDTISVGQQQPQYSWGASLWYCKLPKTEEYRWYETSYFGVSREERMAPYALTEIRDADLAAAPIMHAYQIAWGPNPLDDEDAREFCERWAALLALAAQGRLEHPRRLPLAREFWKEPFVA